MSSLTAPLFQPFFVRSLAMANRTVMAPMGRQFAINGVPHPHAAAYYRRRAEGRVGLVITEATGIDHPLATDAVGVPLMHGDAALQAWKSVVEEVHRVGGLIMPQLFHQGMLRGGGLADPAMQSMRPSGTIGDPGPTSFSPKYIEGALMPTRPMTESEIADGIAAFARSAAHAVKLGFDGIELHGAHGYFVDSFLWGESNKRTDRYGGNIGQRTAVAVEVIRAVRTELGNQKPLFFRFSQHKSSNYDARTCQTPAELEAMLGPIADAGVDVLDASIRRFWLPAFDGSPLNLAGWAKKLTGKPVIAVGSIGLDNSASDTFLAREGAASDNIPLLMERFNSGEFDLVSIGRSLISDPNYVAKIATGRPVTPFTRAALNTLI